MTQPLVLITAKCHDIIFETLTKKGFKYHYAPAINYAEVLQTIHQYTGLITTTSVIIDKAILDAATQLQWLGRLGSGLEHIDVAYAQQKGINVQSSPEGNCQAVAEHALGMLLCLMNNINIAENQVQQGLWIRDANRGEELMGKTVGIIGYGNTGQAFANLLKPFNVKLLVNDKYKSGFGTPYITEASVQDICEQAHVISFHLPLTQEVKYFANKSFFQQLNQKVYLINTSRGMVVNTPHLIEALQNKTIKAAAIDVLENENLTSYSEQETQMLQTLSQMPNVLVTPHIAGYSHEALYKMASVCLNKLGLL